MTRFHVNGKGNPGPCAASDGRCPFGTDEEHYPTAEEARAAFEAAQDSVPEIVSRRSNQSAASFAEAESKPEPLERAEEEQAPLDVDHDVSAPEEYRGMSVEELRETLNEEDTEARYSLEEAERQRTLKWSGIA